MFYLLLQLNQLALNESAYRLYSDGDSDRRADAVVASRRLVEKLSDALEIKTYRIASKIIMEGF